MNAAMEESAFQRAQETHAKYKLTPAFPVALLDHLHNGIVVSTPSSFAMGKTIKLADGRLAWFITLASGSFRRALGFLPWPVRFIAFRRRGAEAIKVYPTEEFLGRCAAATPDFTTAPDPLEAFADWFLARPIDLLRPPIHGVYHYGELMSVVLYRAAQFQAELFIVQPNPTERCGQHGHPDIDSMEVAISGELCFILDRRPIMPRKVSNAVAEDGALQLYGHRVRVRPGQAHTAIVGPQGGCFLSLQHWLNGVSPSSIGLNWSGEEHAAAFKERYQEKSPC